jgi:hypothetical protein
MSPVVTLVVGLLVLWLATTDRLVDVWEALKGKRRDG